MATAGAHAGDDRTWSAQSGAVARAVEAMRDALDRPHPLPELARVAMFSPYHFHEIFRAVTAVTPARFLAVLRMAEARRLLLHTALPVAELCARVGYHSAGSFTAQFGRLIGVSPARFRALIRSSAHQRAGPSPVLPAPSAGVTDGPSMVLTAPPEPGSLVYGCLLGGGGRPVTGRWSVATGAARVPLPAPPAAGEYAAFLLVVAGGARLADALVDDVPGSYSIGRATVSLPDRRATVSVPVALRRPLTTDPPIPALTPPQWTGLSSDII